MPQLSTLDELGLKHGTDKSSAHHDYLRFFETFFAPLRDEPVTLLEIGVHRGASLRMWEDYFPRATIIGVDILPACKRFEHDRVRIELADQSNVEHLAHLALKHGPFDIIIEDGSHMWEHQITSVRTLFPFLKNAGYYIAEDLQTNYGAMREQYRGVATESCVDFLKSWMDLCVGDDQIDIRGVEDAFLRTYGRALEFMAFQRRACILKKKIAPPDWRVNPGPPLVARAPGGQGVLASVVAHVGLRGDILGPLGFVDLGSDPYTIQGFSIDAPESAVEYRVRYPDLSWSEWTQRGVFAGTRGRSIPVTGFSARLREGMSEKYALSAFGRFVGVETPLEAKDGEDCVSAAAEPLRGLQIDLIARD